VRDDGIVVKEISFISVTKSFTALIQTTNIKRGTVQKQYQRSVVIPGEDPGSPKGYQRYDT